MELPVCLKFHPKMKTIAIFTILCTATIVSPKSTIKNLDNACKGLDPTQIIYLPVPGDCSKYIECYNEVGTLFQCAPGLWWHPEINECDYPGSYCTETTSTSQPTTTSKPTTTTISTTSPIPTIVPPPGPDPRCIDDTTQLWPHPASCDKYVECYKGNSYIMSCPPGLYFSDSHKECVNADESDCCKTSSQC